MTWREFDFNHSFSFVQFPWNILKYDPPVTAELGGHENAGHRIGQKSVVKAGSDNLLMFHLKASQVHDQWEDKTLWQHGKILKLLKKSGSPFLITHIMTLQHTSLTYSLSFFRSLTETHTHKIIFQLSSRHWHCILILNPPWYILNLIHNMNPCITVPLIAAHECVT